MILEFIKLLFDSRVFEEIRGSRFWFPDHAAITMRSRAITAILYYFRYMHIREVGDYDRCQRYSIPGFAVEILLEKRMGPLAASRRVLLRKMVPALLACGLFLLPQANAFQSTIHIEANEAGRKIKSRVNPEYPELALKARITGTARVQMTVSQEGTVKDVKELGGSPVLLGALVRAVKQWKYEPGPKDTEVEVSAAFSR